MIIKISLNHFWYYKNMLNTFIGLQLSKIFLVNSLKQSVLLALFLDNSLSIENF
jgi:hypothetical protein